MEIKTKMRKSIKKYINARLKLKPCPFCNSSAKIVRTSGTSEDLYYVLLKPLNRYTENTAFLPQLGQ
jgi:hypothetical protein